MEYNTILCLIILISIVLSMIVIPLLKKKGLWTATLFAVNIAEQIFAFSGAGEYKFKWVDDLLKQFAPKLTDLEREMLIEELVERLNTLKEE